MARGRYSERKRVVLLSCLDVGLVCHRQRNSRHWSKEKWADDVGTSNLYPFFILLSVCHSLSTINKKRLLNSEWNCNVTINVIVLFGIRMFQQLVFKGPVRSGFLPQKWATSNRNWLLTKHGPDRTKKTSFFS